MNIRLFAALALTVVLPAALRAQGEVKPAALAVDPVGKYAASVVVQGQPADFELVIEKKEDGSLGGTMSNPNYGTSVISSLKVEGRTVKMVIATPQGVAANIEFTLLEDNTVDGSWSMEGDGGKVTGKKSP
ncbi:MAG: hypothetical protein AABZ29_06610 [Gemmatimonadota bacterium]